MVLTTNIRILTIDLNSVLVNDSTIYDQPQSLIALR